MHLYAWPRFQRPNEPGKQRLLTEPAGARVSFVEVPLSVYLWALVVAVVVVTACGISPCFQTR